MIVHMYRWSMPMGEYCVLCREKRDTRPREIPSHTSWKNDKEEEYRHEWVYLDTFDLTHLGLVAEIAHKGIAYIGYDE